MPKEQADAAMGEYFAFTDSIKKSGQYVAGDALHPTQTATTVRVRNGKTLTTDGPFAETKEQLGGYYLIDRKSTRLNSSHRQYLVCRLLLEKKKKQIMKQSR